MAEDSNKSAQFPDDVVETILLKLPVKSLLRFQTVSKFWNTMISDPRFVRNHLRRSENSSSQTNLFVSKLKDEVSLVKFEGGKFQTVGELKNPNPSGWDVVCSCDGVILLRAPTPMNYLLWNPSTRAYMSFYSSFNFDYMSYGLCYGSIPEEFKVVFIPRNLRINYYIVYSCKTKCWNKKTTPFPATDRVSIPGIYFEGSIYWVTEHHEKLVREIYYFDPKDDKMNLLQKPANVGGGKPILLTVLKGCLCVYCTGEDDVAVLKIWIWIKEKENDEEKSWKEFITIENVQGNIGVFRPLFFVENRVVVHWIIDGTSRMSVYNTCEKKCEDSDGTTVLGDVFVPCVDTLFLPPQNIRPKRKRNSVSSGSSVSY